MGSSVVASLVDAVTAVAIALSGAVCGELEAATGCWDSSVVAFLVAVTAVGARIEAIVLGQHAAGAGELTKLVRVDTSHRQSGREQGTDDSALVTTARLQANCGDCERRNLTTS